jgi:hypothetical protein
LGLTNVSTLRTKGFTTGGEGRTDGAKERERGVETQQLTSILEDESTKEVGTPPEVAGRTTRGGGTPPAVEDDSFAGGLFGLSLRLEEEEFATGVEEGLNTSKAEARMA